MYQRNRSNWNQQEVLQEPLEPIGDTQYVFRPAAESKNGVVVHIFDQGE